MANYSINFKPAALRQLKKLPSEVQKALIMAIEALAEKPRPNGCKKLRGSMDLYRIRVAQNYRVIYSIQDTKLIILVVKIGHRKNIYQ